MAHDTPLREVDPAVYDALQMEVRRETETLELIASENFVSEAVLEAMGSVFTNKYAEGYPGKRYYGGCGPTDIVETLAIERAKQLFSAEHANVQPHSGSQANTSVYLTVLSPGDTVLGMDLSHGGHLTHGHPLNFSGLMYRIVPYGVRREDEILDYEALARLAEENKPKLIVAGASAYSRAIDWARIQAIADSCGALVMADIAHYAGLVAVGLYPSPVPHCAFVTSTTHKTLRGPRAGLVLCKEKWAKDLDRRVFPGVQGGPLVHIIAAKAVAFGEALRPEFREYQAQILRNAKTLAATVAEGGYRIVSGGTDCHLFMVDVFVKGITGKEGEAALEKAGITVNKNTIPFDQNKPMIASGIRLGTPALTTRGMKEPEMKQIGAWITEALDKRGDDAALARIREEIRKLTARFPIYERRIAR